MWTSPSAQGTAARHHDATDQGMGKSEMITCQQCGGDIARCTQPIDGSCGWVMVARTEWDSLIHLYAMANPEKSRWDAQPSGLRKARTTAIRQTFTDHQRLIESMLPSTPTKPRYKCVVCGGYGVVNTSCFSQEQCKTCVGTGERQ
jgi:hypothetical protein